jgi:hypothetical protein
MKRILLAGAMTLAIVGGAQAATFGGYECTKDCSGHWAGYEWAIAKDIVSKTQCEAIVLRAPKRTSFYEGCLTYVEGRVLLQDYPRSNPQRFRADNGPLWPLPLAAAVIIGAAWLFRFAPALKRWKRDRAARAKTWKEKVLPDGKLSAFDKVLFGSVAMFLLLFIAGAVAIVAH